MEQVSSRALGWTNHRRWIVFALAAPSVLLVHLFASAALIDQANQDLSRSDQGAEIWMARITSHHAHLWPMHTDGVRHPMWSWVARAVLDPDDDVFFRNGKWLNTALSCVFVVLLGAMATAAMGGLPGATVMALSSLGILLVRGVFFQPEPLYYAFSFLAAFACWKILGRSAWWWYPVLGVTAGFAALSKPSIEPMAVVFIAALCFRALLEWQLAWRDLAGLLVAGGIGLAMSTPLLLQKHELFGSPSFSYPKVWMWMDDFDSEAWPWQKANPGRVQLEALDPTDIPSPSWYFARHGFGDASLRLANGTREVFSRFLFPETRRSFGEFFWKSHRVRKWEQPLSARGIYLFVLAALPLVLFVRTEKPLGRLLSPPALSHAAFALGLFVIYLLLYGWYYPIGRGDRFMGSLWIPCVFLACHLGHQAFTRSAVAFKNSAFFGVHIVVLVSLALQAANLLALLAGGTTPTLRN